MKRAPNRRSRRTKRSSRRIRRIWTWDRGGRPVDMDAPSDVLVPILETVLAGGLWTEFRKFPVDTLERLLPLIRVPANTRDLIGMWIEEAPARDR